MTDYEKQIIVDLLEFEEMELERDGFKDSERYKAVLSAIKKLLINKLIN